MLLCLASAKAHVQKDVAALGLPLPSCLVSHSGFFLTGTICKERITINELTRFAERARMTEGKQNFILSDNRG